MTVEEVQLLAFQMISKGGDALDCFYQALSLKLNKQHDLAMEKLDEGKKSLNECHDIQTKLIQAEAIGESVPYSLIMTHAQDHFTTAMNWKRMAELLLIETH